MYYSAALVSLFMVAASGAPCNLYLSPTMANPIGQQTCVPSGSFMFDKGKSCLKMSMPGLTTQNCDFTPSHQGDMFLCETFGLGANPSQCCTVADTGAKIMCSDAGYTTAPQESDFANCPACVVGGGAQAAVTTTAAVSASTTQVTVPMFPIYLLLVNIEDTLNAFFTRQDDVSAALIQAIAKSFGIDAKRVTITDIWKHLAAAGGRRLTGQDIGVNADIENSAGDITPQTADAARSTMAANINSQLQNSGISASVGSVAENPQPLLIDPVSTTTTTTVAPATTAPAPASPCATPAPVTTPPASPCATAAPATTVTTTPAPPASPCATAAPAATVTTTPGATQTTTPAPVALSPCATAAPSAKNAVEVKAKSAMQQVSGAPTSTLMIAMCFLAACAVIGVGIRLRQRKTRQSRSYKPLSELAIASDMEGQTLE